MQQLDNVNPARIIQSAKVTLADPHHPLHVEFQHFQSGKRNTFPKRAKSNKYLRLFVPSAVGFLASDCVSELCILITHLMTFVIFIECFYAVNLAVDCYHKSNCPSGTRKIFYF